MSLILEALRKSEAERRRGQAPDLRAELPPATPRARQVLPAWAWIAIVATALLLALLVLWLRAGGSGPDAPVDDQQPADIADAATTDTPPPAPAPADPFPQVDRIEPPRQETPATMQPAAPVADTGPPPTAAPEPAIADRGAPPPDLPPPPAPARPAPAPATGDMPRLSELPSAQRQRLPAMKLSMHMWNEDPARRFAIVDGVRLVEGDRVGDATVAAIDADGLVLDLDGQPVRVPLR